MASDQPASADRTDAVIDEILDHVLRGAACDVELILARYSDLSEVQRKFVRATAADLLSRDDGGRSALANAMLQAAPTTPAAEIPTKFGAYVLLEELGRGGQGIVYLAQDTRLPRKVALKILNGPESVLPNDKSASASAARLMREAEVAAKLDHPSICVVHEVGSHDGRPFIAMRFVEGETLAKKIAHARAADRDLNIAPRSLAPVEDFDPSSTVQQRRSVSSCVQLVESAARAMHVAHQAHIVHRDVKPANIMVTPAAEPVILDFGLARDQSSEAATLTLSGEVFGSPAYMSPEQIEARRGAIDARTDVYSLGVVLYESLTLRRPFDAPTRDGLYRAILNEPALDVRVLRPGLPRDLAIVIATALEKDLGRRYRSALDFAEDLRRVREHEPILARPAGAALRLRRWTQRNPRLATAVAGAFVALLATIGVLKWMLVRERTQRLLAQSAGFRAVDPARALRCAEQAAQLGAAPEAELDLSLLNALSELREVRCVPAHAQQIHDAQSSRDGLWLATAGDDGAVRLWDGHTWEMRREITDFNSSPRIALSPDGRWLAAESDFDAVRVWDTATWQVHLLDMPAHHGSMSFAPDSARLSFLTNDGNELHVLAVDPSLRAEPRRIVSGPTGPCSEIVWSPDSRWIFLSCSRGYRLIGDDEPPIEQSLSQPTSLSRFDFSADGRLALLPDERGLVCFDLHDRRVLESYPPDSAAAREIQLARLDPSGKRVLLAYRDGGADIFERGSAACPLTLQVGNSSISEASFSRDGSRILMLRSASSPVVCDARTGDRLAELATAQGDSANTAMWDESDRGAPCVTFHTSGAMRRWRLENGWERATFRGFCTFANSVGFDSRGERVVAARALAAQVVDWRTGERGAELGTQMGRVLSVAFGPDDISIAAGSEDSSVCIWDLASAAKRHEWRLPDQVWSIDYSPDGSALACACSDGLVHVLDAVGGGALEPFRDHEGGVRSVRFDARGERVVSVSETDGWVRVWDFASRTQKAQHFVAKYRAVSQPHAPLFACFAPDGQRVAITSYDGMLREWDTRTGAIDERKLCETAIYCADYSPDGKWLAVGTDNRIVYMLQLGGARRVVPLTGHRGGVKCVRFSRDGRALVSQDNFGDVHVWRTDLREAAREALHEIEPIALTGR